MKQDLNQRKNIRLESHDYSRAGCYFITICVIEKHPMLGKILPVQQEIVLSEIGWTVKNEIRKIPDCYEDVAIDKYVVMPNHIHMILTTGNRTQIATSVSRIIKQFKGSITKQIGFSLWQRSFYDHVVRDQKDYRRLCQYIEMNPSAWKEDMFFVLDSE
ncbi:MAG: transposase [Oscillospiraceae bacterium]|nr:transposase [Oscillospiraceae bacterium]